MIKFIKEKVVLLFICFSSLGLHGQAGRGDLVVFTDLDDSFTLYVNGVAQNGVSGHNVKVKDLLVDSVTNYRVTVKFDNADIEKLSKNVTVSEDEETTYRLKKNRKGS